MNGNGNETEVFRTNILTWLSGGPNGEACSKWNGFSVFPSDVDEDGPGDAYVRESAAKPYTIETNIVMVKHDNVLTAFPTKITQVVKLPGTKEPMEITCEENQRREGVIYIIKFDDFPAKIPSFPGNFQRFDELTPNKEKSEPWECFPKDQDKVMCWMGYDLSNEGKLVGYAYPDKGNGTVDIEPETAKVFRLPDGTQLVLAPGADADAWKDQDGTFVFEVRIGTELKLPNI